MAQGNASLTATRRGSFGPCRSHTLLLAARSVAPLTVVFST